jgi:hypothetical protein
MPIAVRRYTFRLYPNRTQTSKLFEVRRLHAYLYNAALAHRKTEYERFGKSVDYFQQQNVLPAFKEDWPEYKELNSQTLQATLKRIDFAYNRFFRGLTKRPKFKSIRLFSGWSYPGFSGWDVLTNGCGGDNKVIRQTVSRKQPLNPSDNGSVCEEKKTSVVPFHFGKSSKSQASFDHASQYKKSYVDDRNEKKKWDD